ncbi:MAG: LysM peptidoglycan-binding domain-containing protein [Bacteriovoracia bacterium]
MKTRVFLVILGVLLTLFAVPTRTLGRDFLYTVKKGETLSEITQRFLKPPIYGKHGSLKKLMKDNPHLRSRIEPGQRIRIKQSIQSKHAQQLHKQQEQKKEPPLPPEQIKDPEPIKKEEPKLKEKKPIEITNLADGFAALEIAVRNFSQSSVTSFSAVNLAARGGYKFQVAKGFEAGLEGSLTLYPISSTLQTGTVRFINLDIFGGYSYKFSGIPLVVGGRVGFSTSTMLSRGIDVGFTNFIYPYFSPLVIYGLPEENYILGQLKYAPLGSDFGLSFSEREIAAKATLVHPLQSGNFSLLYVNYSTIQFLLDSTTLIRSDSLIFGIGYGF